MDWNLWTLPNFTPQEVACTCIRCKAMNPQGISRMSLETMKMFQEARNILEQPIYGTSWGRCTHHNKNEGGKWDSAHIFTATMLAEAGDVTLTKKRPMTPSESCRLLKALIHSGFERLGVDTDYRFIHADNRPSKPSPALWFY